MTKQIGDWQAEYREWKLSGERQIDYCKRKKINLARFRNGVHRSKASGRAGGFKCIKIEAAIPKPSEAPYCEIVFSGSHRIRVESQESLSYLKNLLKVWMQP